MSQIEIEISQTDITTAADRAAHTAMGFIVSGFADCDTLQDDRFARYERLGRYLSICRELINRELERQQDKAERIMWNLEGESPDTFHFDGIRRKKKKTKTA